MAENNPIEAQNVEEAAVQVTKHKRHKNNVRRTYIADDETKGTIQNAIEIMSWPVIDRTDPQQVEDRCIKYFEWCAETGSRPGLAALALALGIERTTLWRYVNGMVASAEPVVPVLKRAVAVMNMLMEEFMMNGKINVVAGIFILKNNYGYKDQSDVVITPQKPLGEQKSAEMLAQEYLQSIPDDALPQQTSAHGLPETPADE